MRVRTVPSGTPSVLAMSANFRDACQKNTWTAYGIIGVSVSVVAIGITAYMAFGRDESHAPPTSMTGRRTKKKKAFSVTPVVSADGGGATVQIDW